MENMDGLHKDTSHKSSHVFDTRGGCAAGGCAGFKGDGQIRSFSPLRRLRCSRRIVGRKRWIYCGAPSYLQLSKRKHLNICISFRQVRRTGGKRRPVESVTINTAAEGSTDLPKVSTPASSAELKGFRELQRLDRVRQRLIEWLGNPNILLVRKGFMWQDNKTGFNLLHLAVRLFLSEIVEEMYFRFPHETARLANVKDATGKTPIDHALIIGEFNTIKVFRRAKLDQRPA